LTWKHYWQREGGGREVLQLAWPLILSNGFLTLQLIIDRIFLSQASSEAIAASMPAALMYWTPMALLQNTANYATTFVAQYTGARRPSRVGPSVWQAYYFSLAAGLAILLLIPLARTLVALGGHSASVQELEVTYFQVLCFAAFPALIVQATNSFFAGRGESRIVLLIDGTGMTVNAVLAYGLILGNLGLPELGIAGAGLATVIGSCTSAGLALGLFFGRKYRQQFHTLAGWRFDAELFRRLMRFGLPNGMQWMLDGLAFTVFLFLVGRIGDVELAATNVAFSVNMLALLPMLGIGQAVSILVGQRLGQDKPALAERSTWTGFMLAWVYMSVVAALYALVPELFLYFFQSDRDAKAVLVAALVPVLLRYVAVYSLFDSLNVIFSFGLRGAGDTRFVTLVSLVLAWPLMVVPTWAAWRYDWGLYWAWGFASLYIIAMGFIFLLRFRTGIWKSMRVIETTVVEAPMAALEPEPEGQPA
jgi:MATE family multidrug resistance protein